MIKNYWISVFSLIAVIAILSCQPDPGGSTNTATAPLQIPVFNGKNAYDHIATQVSFGYRVPGTEGHMACKDWIVERLESLGAKVIVQEFSADFLGSKNVTCFNVMGQFNPQLSKRILLAAHWDTRAVAEKDPDPGKRQVPILGADDGGSGVAVLLEIARVISENPIDMGVDILFFDAEDQGDHNSSDFKLWGLGSQYWSNNKVPPNYKAKFGILLDMVGSKDATFGKEEYSRYYANNYVRKIWTLAERMGYSDYFQNFAAGSVTDDHYYVNVYGKIPMLNIINMSPADRKSFGKYHHTHEDNMDIISERTLKVVGQVVTAALYKESEGSL